MLHGGTNDCKAFVQKRFEKFFDKNAGDSSPRTSVPVQMFQIKPVVQSNEVLTL